MLYMCFCKRHQTVKPGWICLLYMYLNKLLREENGKAPPQYYSHVKYHPEKCFVYGKATFKLHSQYCILYYIYISDKQVKTVGRWNFLWTDSEIEKLEMSHMLMQSREVQQCSALWLPIFCLQKHKRVLIFGSEVAGSPWVPMRIAKQHWNDCVALGWLSCQHNSRVSQRDGHLTLRNQRQSNTLMSISHTISFQWI